MVDRHTWEDMLCRYAAKRTTLQLDSRIAWLVSEPFDYLFFHIYYAGKHSCAVATQNIMLELAVV
jgi:hypothetical protein